MIFEDLWFDGSRPDATPWPRCLRGGRWSCGCQRTGRGPWNWGNVGGVGCGFALGMVIFERDSRRMTTNSICKDHIIYLEGHCGIITFSIGWERWSGRGDTANKIGTYSLAVLSRYHGVPFYVAAPLTTLDASLLKDGWVGSIACKNGPQIPTIFWLHRNLLVIWPCNDQVVFFKTRYMILRHMSPKFCHRKIGYFLLECLLQNGVFTSQSSEWPNRFTAEFFWHSSTSLLSS